MLFMLLLLLVSTVQRIMDVISKKRNVSNLNLTSSRVLHSLLMSAMGLFMLLILGEVLILCWNILFHVLLIVLLLFLLMLLSLFMLLVLLVLLMLFMLLLLLISTVQRIMDIISKKRNVSNLDLTSSRVLHGLLMFMLLVLL